jgi:alcohol dehydrogenase
VPELEPVTLRDPLPGEVLVRVAAAGICHTDLHFASGDREHPLPVVLGHEGAGVIEAVGPGVTLSPGDRVLFNLAPSCGSCRACATGRPSLCELWPGEGQLATGPSPIEAESGVISSFAGASCFARHAVVPAASVLPLPAAVSEDVGALVSCAVITGFGAATEALDLRPGGRGAVIGLGAVGASALLAAGANGAAECIAIDPVAERREVALELGAGRAASPEELADRFRGELDWTIVAAGGLGAAEMGLDLLSPGGTSVVVALTEPRLPIDLTALVEQEKTLRGSSYGSRTAIDLVPRILALYESGALNLDALVTKRLPLNEIAAGFDLAARGIGLRTVLHP